MGRGAAGQEMHNQLDIGIFNELTEWQSLFFCQWLDESPSSSPSVAVVLKWTLNLTEAASPVRHVEVTQIYVMQKKKKV